MRFSLCAGVMYYKIEDKTVTIPGGNGYRLPTEAEWEYACRAPQGAGSATKHPFGGNGADLSSYAWFDGNSGEKTHPVGQLKPNRWGLYDMQGNVWEWCQDFYSADYYTFSPETDPPGPAAASNRVIRGGSWNNNPRNCRPANRNRNEPDNRNNNLGFRLAAALPVWWIPRRTGPAARLPRSTRFRPGERRFGPPRAGSDREGSGRSRLT